MQGINNFRSGMCPANIHFDFVRVSDMFIRGDSAIAIPLAPTGTYTVPVGKVNLPPDAALVLRCEATPLRRSFRYLHGLTSNDTVGNVWSPTAGMIAALTSYLTFINTNTVQRHIVSRSPLNVVDTAWTNFIEQQVNSRKVGRPFGLPRGRRLIA
jgi:hypothetical protein